MRIGGTELILKQGDITQEAVDALVNAANSRLAGGGGVDGAIHKAGGPAIMQELDEIRAATGGCPTGSAVVTGGGLLAARHVIHAVGPIWQGGTQGEPELLRKTYLSSLSAAAGLGARTLAFPSISTGVYGYPIEKAAAVALSVIKDFIDHSTGSLFRELRVVLFSDRDLKIYQRVAGEIFGEE